MRTSYRDGTDSGLSKRQTRRSLARFTVFESLRQLYLMLSAGNTMIFVAFVLSLGVAKEQVGYFSSLASAACIVPLMLMPVSLSFQKPSLPWTSPYFSGMGCVPTTSIRRQACLPPEGR
jgi:hypothetical protein